MSDELTNSPADGAKAPAFLSDATFIALDGKTPVKKGWTTDPAARFDADEAYPRVSAGGNVGVALGPDDLVLDVDPRNFATGDDPFDRLKAQIGDDLSGFPAVRTGSGGWHVYMRVPEGTGRIKRDLARDGFPGIDLKFVGGQVVAPGSTHPDTGKPYVVERDLDPLDEGLGLPVAPAALMELVKRPERSVRAVAPGAKSPEWLALALDKLPVEDYLGLRARPHLLGGPEEAGFPRQPRRLLGPRRDAAGPRDDRAGRQLLAAVAGAQPRHGGQVRSRQPHPGER